VELYEQIRKAHEREKLSIHELARRFGTHRRYVRQASSRRCRHRGRARSRFPVLGRYHATIDAWLVADRDAPRKQRHTAHRVWERLVEEQAPGCRVDRARLRAPGQEAPGLEPGGGDGSPAPRARAEARSISDLSASTWRRAHRGGAIRDAHVGFGQGLSPRYGNEAQEVFLDDMSGPSRSSVASPDASATTT